jgi:hypothetical protein
VEISRSWKGRLRADSELPSLACGISSRVWLEGVERELALAIFGLDVFAIRMQFIKPRSLKFSISII